jgi:hypothetical protein
MLSHTRQRERDDISRSTFVCLGLNEHYNSFFVPLFSVQLVTMSVPVSVSNDSALIGIFCLYLARKCTKMILFPRLAPAKTVFQQ